MFGNTSDFRDILMKNRTIPALLNHRVKKTPEKEFIYYKGEEITYYDFSKNVNLLANALAKELEIRKGTLVLVLMPNSIRCLELFFALWTIGAIVIPLGNELVGNSLFSRIKQSKSDILFVEKNLIQNVSESNSLSLLKTMIVDSTKESEQVDMSSNLDIFIFQKLIDANKNKDNIDFEDIKYSDPASILFTSGTTDAPKGVLVSHHFYLYYSWVFYHHMGYTKDDILYTCLPLNHTHAQNSTVLPAIFAGATVALSARFSASSFWKEIANSRATVFSAIGGMGNILLNRAPDKWENSNNVRLAQIVPPPNDLEKFEKRFNLDVVHELYGSTEAMVFPPIYPRTKNNVRNIGLSPKDWEIRVADENGLPVLEGEIGELLIRPRIPNILFDEYWGMPEVTLQAFKGLWFHTKDLVRQNKNGYIIVDRAKDLIRRKGENISTYELESLVMKSGFFSEVAVIGVPSLLGEQDISLYCVPLKENINLESSLIEYLKLNLPKYMHPSYLYSRKYLPKTHNGKVNKKALFEEWIKNEEGLRHDQKNK